MSKSKCFRISDIPEKWSEKDLRHSLENLDPSLHNLDYALSLYPACHGFGQTAILNIPQCTDYFKQIVPYKAFFARVQKEQLSIDCDFNGLTPFNAPPNQILAE
jgi:hypothetical protein